MPVSTSGLVRSFRLMSSFDTGGAGAEGGLER
jgi:hypothetical protein